MNVNEGLLATKLEELDRLLPDSGDLRGLLESFLRTASDGELVRINPSRLRRATAKTKRL